MRLFTKGQRFFVLDYETTGLDMEASEPIEVGIIACDEHFNLLETYSSLIAPRDYDSPRSWGEIELAAFRIHGISPANLGDAPKRGEVGTAIFDLAKRHTGRGGLLPVLVSDNIQFEWHWTRRLLSHVAWPFHYCGWDSSLLLEATGVGDPKPAHRALADAGLLHAAIIKALARITP
jgi:DNA polymerase III epsilon subunit-like protein